METSCISLNITDSIFLNEEKIIHARDIFHLENANRTLQTKVEGALSDCAKMNQSYSHLEDVIKDLHFKLTASEQRWLLSSPMPLLTLLHMGGGL